MRAETTKRDAITAPAIVAPEIEPVVFDVVAPVVDDVGVGGGVVSVARVVICIVALDIVSVVAVVVVVCGLACGGRTAQDALA